MPHKDPDIVSVASGSVPTTPGRARDGPRFVWNLSVRGLYVVVNPSPAQGRKVSVLFSLSGEERPVKVEARVAWQNLPSSTRGCGSRAFNLPPGCGLEFLVIDRKDLQRIEAHVGRTPVLEVGWRGRRRGRHGR